MAKRGPKGWSPTDEQRADVLQMASRGVPHETIAVILEVAENTLRKHCEAELKQGKAKCTQAFIGTLYTLAIVERNPAAIFFYLKTREGWREKDPEIKKKPKTVLNLIRGETRKSQRDGNGESDTGTG